MKTVRRGAIRYPWDDWLAKSEFTLVRGVQFFGAVHGMMGMLRNAARLRGVRVSLHADEFKINVKVTLKEKTDAPSQR